ncbi:cyclic nucleotide-binding domain-containing protein [Legionella septentrionalis]|uniref:cyclic nucleotide-binding domain-containing protein n=1 Tax=Legionella septentrionalis TaxID=2498109 RepID=UPI000F8CA064|nr:cyclic nucleotide-binding domain-containing protein [Legionella septentrionalis]RUQ98713.1 cyclic nucleotide-binding domain-containing protein [Legionella septentrionalis]
MHTERFEHIKNQLKSNFLFSGLTEQELETLASLAKEYEFSAAEFIIEEDEAIPEKLYLIEAGVVEILKKSAKDEQGDFYRITTLASGEIIGEVALLEDAKRTASARAVTPTKVIALPLQELKNLSTSGNKTSFKRFLKPLRRQVNEPSVHTKLIQNLAKNLSRRLANTNAVTAESLRAELKLSQMRISMGRFLIGTLSALSIYTYCLSFIATYSNTLPSTTIVAVPLMLFFSGVIFYFMMKSGYPLAFFGLTLQYWRGAVLESVGWTFPVMGLIVLAKWLFIEFAQLHIPLFEGYHASFRGGNTALIIASIITYLIMVPLQELIMRGAVQGSLQHFFTGKHAKLSAILVSNLIFGATHLHISLIMGVLVMIFGIFWGIMYARQGNLVGVSVSHLMIGYWAFFVVGIENILD